MTYFVIYEGPCPECDGCGTTAPYEDLYHEFIAASEAERKRLNVVQSDELRVFEEQWWADRGYPGGPMHWPPAGEVDCPKCNGTGKIKRRVPLQNALRDLGVDVWGGENSHDSD